MPVTSVLLSDTDQHIATKVKVKVTKDLVEALSLRHLDVSLRLEGDGSGPSLTDGKGNTTPDTASSGMSRNIPQLLSSNKITLTIGTTMDEDDMTTTAVHQRSSPPIFKDSSIGVDIAPIYVRETYNVEFRYKTNSKTEALRIHDKLRLSVSQTRNILMHSFEYTIPIPTYVEEFIEDVWKLKDRLEPQPLEEYFRKHSTNRVHLLTDMSNKENTILAINEVQKRVVGAFDFSPIPEKIQENKRESSYVVAFNYEFTIDSPKAFTLRYPVMICNQPIPNKYIDYIQHSRKNEDDYNLEDNLYTGSLGQALSTLEYNRQIELVTDTKIPYNVPLYDEFIPETTHEGYVPMITILTRVNEDDRKGLFNLTDLDEYRLDDYILEFLKDGDRLYAVRPYESFIYISLFQEGRYFDSPNLYIDEDLNVSSKTPLDLYKPVRVVINFLYDLSRLPVDFYNDIKKEPVLYPKLLKECIEAYNLFGRLRGKGVIVKEAMYELFGNVVKTMIDQSNLSIKGVDPCSGGGNTLTDFLTYLQGDVELYNQVVMDIRDRYPDYLKRLIIAGLLPSDFDYSRMESNYLPPPQEEKREFSRDWLDSNVFIIARSKGR